jgi:hypothetical protein
MITDTLTVQDDGRLRACTIMHQHVTDTCERNMCALQELQGIKTP